MAKVKVFVWHQVSGDIVAVGRPMADTKCVPMSAEAESVFETELEEDAIVDLHRTHIVDLNQTLVARTTAAEDQPGGSRATT